MQDFSLKQYCANKDNENYLSKADEDEIIYEVLRHYLSFDL